MPPRWFALRPYHLVCELPPSPTGRALELHVLAMPWGVRCYWLDEAGRALGWVEPARC
jgi:hypothetical protein